MKEKIRNGLILLGYFLGFSKVRNSILRRRGQSITRIVSFHKIKDVADFENKINFLAENFNIISLDDFLQNRTLPEKINICLTFDDGYRSWLEAVPILQKYRIPATFFVCSGYLERGQDASEKWSIDYLKVKPEPSLTWEEVKEINELPRFEIGGHTMHHMGLGEIDDEKTVRQEVIEDKIRIEKMIGKEISYFAYPFGHPSSFNKKVASIVKEAGYTCAVTLIPGINDTETNRFFLHRDCIDDLNSLLMIKAWLYGNYDMLKKLLIISTEYRDSQRLFK